MSFCSMSYHVLGTVSCVPGGETMATKISGTSITDVTWTSRSTMATVILPFHIEPTGICDLGF